MIFGHPPPARGPLRAQLVRRLAYLADLLQVGLDDYASIYNPAERQAYRSRIQEYISYVERLVASLPHNADTCSDQVLMDVPVCVVEQETGTAEWFTVVGPDEVDTATGLISLLSPLGTALLFKRVEETFVLEAPGGRYFYRVGVIGNPTPEIR